MIPLDAHAHVPLSASVAEVAAYAPSLVMAVTRAPTQWPTALRRRDSRIAWGIGCHPGDEQAVAQFEERRFAGAARAAAFIGEVGLDARSRVPLAAQQTVLDSVLRVGAGEGLIVSLHVAGRVAEALDLLSRHPDARVILHWWTGSPEQTAAASDLGCYFSINGAARPHVLKALPRDRTLTETDFPFTKRMDPAATAPGRVAKGIALLSSTWTMAPAQVTELVWQNLASLDSARHLRARAAAFDGATQAARRMA